MTVPGYLIVRVAVAVCGSPAVALPVTLKPDVPRGALPLVIVRVVLPGALSVAVADVKVALVPIGRSLTVRLTDPLKPPWEETETVYVVEEPRLTLREPGLIARPKSGGGLTMRVAEVVRVVEPLVPLIVSW